MSSRSGAFSSSVGTKIVIGITGFALFLYLVIHIAGNLIVFFGPDAFNAYAHTLESKTLLLRPIEVALLLIILIHIFKTVWMFLSNQQARPVKYEMKKRAGSPSRKTLASTTMIVSGLWLLVFLLIHVKAFHDGWGHEYPLADGGRDLYRQELETLSNPFLVGFYILSMVVVGSHLWHGISSSLQSLGFDHPVWTPRVLTAGKVIAFLIAGGFIVIAVWAYLQGGGTAV
ncbi:MAG TPA: succinate dehydrogenase cytochrome b subunit [Vicinamibacterales bacterium]|jgi:succinate dehydrogenase / fumarate reductase cytochrome b subunit